MNINLSVDELSALINAQQQITDKNFIIKNIASLNTARSSDLAILLDRGDASVFDPISREKIKNCEAGVILAHKPIVAGKSYLLVDDVLVAFTSIVDYLQKKNTLADEFFITTRHAYISKYAIVHPDALIEVGAVICAYAIVEAYATIGAQSYIGYYCQIGSGALIHPGVKILNDCVIGSGAIIHSGAVIGSDGFGYVVTSTGLRKIPQIGSVVIGKMAEIGANCSIDRASFDQTKIGTGVKIDNGVHVAHNVSIGDGTAILAQTGIAGSVKIGIGCQIGGQVAIKNDVIIGNGVKIVSKSAVMNNVNDGEAVCGIPAIPFMQWKRLQILITKLQEWSKLVTVIKTIVERSNRSWWQRVKLFLAR